jgi:hypothetical protein
MPMKPDAAPGTPSAGSYGLGWGQLTMEWAPAPLLYHGGSNGKNLAHIWVDPPRDFAMVAMTNIGGGQADEGLRALAAELYARYATAPIPTAAPTLKPTAKTEKSGPSWRDIFGPAKRPTGPAPPAAGDTRRGKGL